MSIIPGPVVLGIDVDPQARCAHYHSSLDIVAIKMKCCGEYYACKDCHAALADHPIMTWPRSESHEPAILCGVCRHQISIGDYMNSGDRCSSCTSPFNPGCRNHYHFYFEM